MAHHTRRSYPLLVVLLLLAPTFALAADASDKPGVKKEWPESVTSGSAILRAHLDTKGHPATCSFLWGGTADHDRATPPQAFAPEPRTHEVRALLDGLDPSTRYHYRLECNNLAGVSRSGDVPFYTLAHEGEAPGSPPTVTTGAATAVNGTAATLTGTATAGGTEAACTFELQGPGAEASEGTTHVLAASAVDAPVEERRDGLTPGEAYSFHLRCVNADGSARGATGSFTTGSSTGGLAPHLRILAPDEIREREATLVGEVLDVGSGPAECAFLVDPPVPTGTHTINAPQRIDEVLAGLEPDATYRVALRCANPDASSQTPFVEFRTNAPAPEGLPPHVALAPPERIASDSVTLAADVSTSSPARCTFTLDPLGGTAPGPAEVPAGDSRARVEWTGLRAATAYAYGAVCENEHGARAASGGRFTTSASAEEGPRLVVDLLAPREIGPDHAVVAANVTSDAAGSCIVHHSAGDDPRQVGPLAFGAGNTTVETRLDGLSPGTPHTLRVECAIDGAIVTSGEGAFRTSSAGPDAPPHVATLAPPRVGPDAATLTGRMDGRDRALCRFELAREGETVLTSARYVAEGEFVQEVGGLTPGTSYESRAVCEANGTRVSGAGAPFTTGARSGGAPPATTTGRVSAVWSHGADFTGAVATDEPATCAFRYTDGATVTTLPVEGSGGNRTLAASATDLMPGTTYAVRLVCSNVSGTAEGADVTFVTGAREAGETGVVATLLPRNITVGSATLRARVAAPTSEGIECRFEIATASFAHNGRTLAAGDPVAAGETRLIEAPADGLASGTVHRYYVACESSTSRSTAFGEVVEFATPADHHLTLHGRLFAGAAGLRAGDCAPNLGTSCAGHSGVTFTRHYLGPGYEGAAWRLEASSEPLAPWPAPPPVSAPVEVSVCFEDGHYRPVGPCVPGETSGAVPAGARVAVVTLHQGASAHYSLTV